MNTPVKGTSTDTEITVSWTALTAPATGNSDVLSYNLFWDNGSGGTVDVELTDSLVTSYTVSGLTGGLIYVF